MFRPMTATLCRSRLSHFPRGASLITHRHTYTSSETTACNIRPGFEKSGYYSIAVSMKLDAGSVIPAPIALFLDGLPQGHGPDPISGSDYVWNVASQQTFEQYSARYIYLYAGNHTVGIWCFACSQSTAARAGARVFPSRLTSSAAPPSEPPARGIRPSSRCGATIFGILLSEAVQLWSNADDPDTQAIISSSSGATINSGCWSIPVYVSQDAVIRRAISPFRLNNVMPIDPVTTRNWRLRCSRRAARIAHISLYDPTHRYIQEFLRLFADLCAGSRLSML